MRTLGLQSLRFGFLSMGFPTIVRVATSSSRLLAHRQANSPRRNYSNSENVCLLLEFWSIWIHQSLTLDLSVELEGDRVVEVEVLYENIPWSSCLSASHVSSLCSYASKPRLLKTPLAAAQLHSTGNLKALVTGSNTSTIAAAVPVTL